MLRRISLATVRGALLLAPAIARGGSLPIEGTPITKEGITTFIESLADTFLTAAALIVVIFIVYGGIKMVMSAGDAAKFGEGKKIIINALIGGAVIFGIGVIISTIAGFSEDPNSVFEGGPL